VQDLRKTKSRGGQGDDSNLQPRGKGSKMGATGKGGGEFGIHGTFILDEREDLIGVTFQTLGGKRGRGDFESRG